METHRSKKTQISLYSISLLMIVAGTIVEKKYNWPYGELVANLGFTIYVVMKLLAFTNKQWSEWYWTDKVRFFLTAFLALMLVFKYIHLGRSDQYFLLVLMIDYIVGRQLKVREIEK